MLSRILGKRPAWLYGLEDPLHTSMLDALDTLPPEEQPGYIDLFLRTIALRKRRLSGGAPPIPNPGNPGDSPVPRPKIKAGLPG